MDSNSKGFVDLKSGLISREIFVNEEVYQEELEQVFTRAWLFIGHECCTAGSWGLEARVGSCGDKLASGPAPK